MKGQIPDRETSLSDTEPSGISPCNRAPRKQLSVHEGDLLQAIIADKNAINMLCKHNPGFALIKLALNSTLRCDRYADAQPNPPRWQKADYEFIAESRNTELAPQRKILANEKIYM